MGKHIYLNTDNAEEILQDVISEIKNKVAFESRKAAFKECTEYWAERVEEIIKDDCPNGVKISRIRVLFGIDPINE